MINQQIERLESQVKEQGVKLNEKTTEIENLTRQLNHKSKQIQALSTKNTTLVKLNDLISAKSEQNKSVNRSISNTPVNLDNSRLISL